jgi:hypothetical protein
LRFFSGTVESSEREREKDRKRERERERKREGKRGRERGIGDIVEGGFRGLMAFALRDLET